MKRRRSVVVFDVNETLLDFSPLDAVFEALLGNAELRSLWFKSTLHTSLVLNETGRYIKFSEVSKSALLSIVRSLRRKVSSAELSRFSEQLEHLPLHADVVPALEHLRDKGFRVAAFTNSSSKGVEDQFERCGVRSFFSAVLSTDIPRLFKPSIRSYQYAAEALRINVSSIVMVAAHSWDTAGAVHAGAEAALIKRPGLIYESVLNEPELKASSLLTLAKRISRTFD